MPCTAWEFWPPVRHSGPIRFRRPWIWRHGPHLPGGARVGDGPAGGAALTITGSNFGEPADTSFVEFWKDGGEVRGTVVSWTDTQIEVTLSGGDLVTARVQNSQNASIPHVGDTVGLDFESDAARVLGD